MPVAKTNFFNPRMIPEEGTEPPPNTHPRAKLVYNILMAVIAYIPARLTKGTRIESKNTLRMLRTDAVSEIATRNPWLANHIREYLKMLTKEDIRVAWEIATNSRPHYGPLGELMIYHPQRDNPILMLVYNNEAPEDDTIRIILPNQRMDFTPQGRPTSMNLQSRDVVPSHKAPVSLDSDEVIINMTAPSDNIPDIRGRFKP